MSDLGSNGTWVNGERIRHEVFLHDGDVLASATSGSCSGSCLTPVGADTDNTEITETPKVSWLLAADISRDSPSSASDSIRWRCPRC